MKLFFADAFFPAPDTHAGDLRTFEIIKMLRGAGHEVTFLARHPSLPHYRQAVADLGVTCVCDMEELFSLNASRFEEFLHKGAFAAAILTHYDVYNLFGAFLRTFLPACHLVLDTVDIHFLRLRREAEHYPDVLARAAQVEQEEVSALRDADSIWVVTPAERDMVTGLLESRPTPVQIIPTIHALLPDPPPFAARTGIVFVGGYRHSPNLDAVYYFMREILPKLRLLLPDAPIAIAGSHPPPELAECARNDAHVSVLGFVPDHRVLLASCRVGIAPLRFGAGMKGKIGDYLACGLPCVTTPIGAEGMGLDIGREIVVAGDADEFAHAVAAVYANPARWEALSAAGREYIRTCFTPEAIAPAVLAAIDLAGQVPARREARPNAKWKQYLSDPAALAQAARRAAQVLRAGGPSALRERVRAWTIKTHKVQ